MRLSPEEFQTLARLQEQMTEGFQRFQSAMFESQQLFLMHSGEIFRRMSSGSSQDGFTGGPLEAQLRPSAAVPTPAVTAPLPPPARSAVAASQADTSAAHALSRSAPQPAPTHMATVPNPIVVALAPSSITAVTSQPAVTPDVQTAAAMAPIAASLKDEDFLAVVRTLVAEKTGYPPEMIEPDMDFEGDLGIDSIKQVEILFALRKQMPHLPEIEPSQLAQLRTLSKIAAHLRSTAAGAEEQLCRRQSE